MHRLSYHLSQCILKKRKAFIPFIVAGDPSGLDTVAVMHTLVEAGADVIELGIPFSDPMADGVVIQKAYERSLASGTTLSKVLVMVAQFRTKNQHTPVVLMGYANPIYQFGLAYFAQEAKKAGVDGMLVVDVGHGAQPWHSLFEAQGIHMIYLVTPTTSLERIKTLGAYANAYIYYVSLKGVTGANVLDNAAVEQLGAHIQAMRPHVDVPIMVGFGIQTPAMAQQVGACCDGVIVGSKLVQGLYQHVQDALQSHGQQANVHHALHWLFAYVQDFCR